jgi:hypothetical protein
MEYWKVGQNEPSIFILCDENDGQIKINVSVQPVDNYAGLLFFADPTKNIVTSDHSNAIGGTNGTPMMGTVYTPNPPEKSCELLYQLFQWVNFVAGMRSAGLKSSPVK